MAEVNFDELERAVEAEAGALKDKPCFGGAVNDDCGACAVGDECGKVRVERLSTLEKELAPVDAAFELAPGAAAKILVAGEENVKEAMKMVADAVVGVAPEAPPTIEVPAGAASGLPEGRQRKSPTIPRNKTRVPFDWAAATTAIMAAKPATVGDSAKICMAQIPENRATAYNNSKKILNKMVESGVIALEGKAITWK